MNIEIKKIKQILNDAPEGATHWDKLQYYRIRYADSSLKVAWGVFNQVSGDFNSVGDTYLTDVYKIQSLSDLRQILALHEQKEKLQLAITNARWTRKEGENQYCNFCQVNLNYSDHADGCVIEELSND